MSTLAPSSTAPAGDPSSVYVTSVYDDDRHVYQFNSKGDVFSALQQLTRARYPLIPLYFHFFDEEGDRCRITNEAELREAIRVCGPHLTVLLSSSLPLNSPAPEVASPTHLSSLSSLSSPSPLLSTLSPSPQPVPSPSSQKLKPDIYPSVEEYLSSDEEDIWEQARSQVRLDGSVSGDVAAKEESEVDVSGQNFGVVALDSDEDNDEDEKVAEAQQTNPLSTTEPPMAPHTTLKAEALVQPVTMTEAPTSTSVSTPLCVDTATESAGAAGEQMSESVHPSSLSEEKAVETKSEAPNEEVRPDVLIAEPVRLSAIATGRVLSRVGFHVAAAATGDSLLALYRQHRRSVRVILLEVDLPGLSGLEVTEQIRQLEREEGSGRSVRIYGHTARVTESNLRRYQKVGMDGCVVKPTPKLDEAVQQALAMTESCPAEFVNLTGTLMTVRPPLPTLPPTPRSSPVVDQEAVQSVINARLKAFYVDHAAAPAVDGDDLGVLIASFFSDPAVVRTITTHSAVLSPLLSSHSLALFLHELSVLNPALSSHPLLARSFIVSGLHAGTTCGVCTVSPIMGTRYSCAECNASLCAECKAMGVHEPSHHLLPVNVAPPSPAGVSGRVASVDEKKEEAAAKSRDLGDRVMEGGRRVWSSLEERLERLDKCLTQYAAEIKRVVEEMMDGVFPSHSSSHSPRRTPPVSPSQRSNSAAASASASAPPCDVNRVCMAPRPFQHPSPAPLAVAVPVEPPHREAMEAPLVEVRAAAAAGQWEAEVEIIREMGLIAGPVEEATVRELLKGCNGDVAQTVQWMVDRLDMGHP